MWTAILTILKSPKNIALLVCAVAIIALLAGAGYYKMRADTLNERLSMAKSLMTAQAEQIEQYSALMAAIKAHDARIAALTTETRKATQAIASLKIEGKCIKDESYYFIADDIAARFNTGVRKAND